MAAPLAAGCRTAALRRAALGVSRLGASVHCTPASHSSLVAPGQMRAAVGCKNTSLHCSQELGGRRFGTAAPMMPTGEWAFRASVLGNEGALAGHIFLDPSGRAAYIADGVQVVGRGVGHWVVDSDARTAAVELDIFQYAAAAAAIPEKPHRFRGVWPLGAGSPSTQSLSTSLTGDWYFCPDGPETPRLVGGFEAAESSAVLLPFAPGLAASTPHRVPAVSALRRDALMEALDGSRPESGAELAASQLRPFALGAELCDEVYYIPDWIQPEQEEIFLRLIDGAPGSWDDMQTRSSQEWGAGDRCGCGRGLRREPLPQWQQELADALHALGIFDGALFPMNSVRINAYNPGQGIHPHCDGPVYYPKVAILSMASPCIFSFYPRTGSEDCMKWDARYNVPGGHQFGSKPLVSVLLEPRSLLVFGRDAFWHHRHGIEATATEQVTPQVCNLSNTSRRPGDVIRRSRRVSLTMRHLLPRCACQG